MSSKGDQLYPFKLVYFIEKGKSVKTIDVVPASWIIYDSDADILMAKFKPPPYTKASFEELQKLVENCEPPSDTWPKYPVEVRGRAQSYEEALNKLKKLNHDVYAFSTDDEESIADKLNEEENTYKSKSKHRGSLSQQLKMATCNLAPIAEHNSPGNNRSRPAPDEKSLAKNKNSSQVQLSKFNEEADTSAEDSDESVSPRKVSKPPAKSQSSKVPAKENAQSEPGVSKDSVTDTLEPRENGEDFNIRRALTNNLNEKPTVVAANQQNAAAPTHPMTNIQKRIAAYMSAHKNETDDPAFLALGGIWNLNMQVTQLRSALTSLSLDVKRVEAKINSKIASNAGADDEDNMKNSNFAHTTLLPFDTINDFEDFDKELKKEPDLRRQTKLHCQRLIRKDQGVVRSMGVILRAYLTQKLALQFTTKKQMPGKHVMKITAFYKCLEDLSMKLWKDDNGPIQNAVDFQNSMASVINNVKDWKPGMRPRKRNANENANKNANANENED